MSLKKKFGRVKIDGLLEKQLNYNKLENEVWVVGNDF